MKCATCGKTLTAKEERYNDIIGLTDFTECVTCREKRTGKKRPSKSLCPDCNERPIEQPFRTCVVCFGQELAVQATFISIQRDHGTIKAMAALPVLKKVAVNGWQDSYLSEYQQKLVDLNEKYAQEDWQVEEFYNLMAEAQ